MNEETLKQMWTSCYGVYYGLMYFCGILFIACLSIRSEIHTWNTVIPEESERAETLVIVPMFFLIIVCSQLIFCCYIKVEITVWLKFLVTILLTIGFIVVTGFTIYGTANSWFDLKMTKDVVDQRIEMELEVCFSSFSSKLF